MTVLIRSPSSKASTTLACANAQVVEAFCYGVKAITFRNVFTDAARACVAVNDWIWRR